MRKDAHMTATLTATFIALYAGHMIGDHIVQTDWQAANKAGKGRDAARAMAGHIGGYVAAQTVALVVVMAAGTPVTFAAALAGLAFSAATHAFIDRRWPVQWILHRTGSRNFAGLTTYGLNGAYLADQALHIGCLFISAAITAAVTAVMT